MRLHRIRMFVSGAWVTIALVIAITSGLEWPAAVALAALGLLPPLALLLWWNEPAQTLSESIDQARR